MITTVDALKIQKNPLAKWVEVDVYDTLENRRWDIGNSNWNISIPHTKEINHLIRLTDWNKVPKKYGYNW